MRFMMLVKSTENSGPPPTSIQLFTSGPGSSAALRRPLPRSPLRRTHRNTRQGEREAHSSRVGSMWTSAWVGPDQCGLQRHP